MMWKSMSKYLGMPPQTRVFCAHEYTQSNAKFGAHVDPDNQAMQLRKQEIDQMRSMVRLVRMPLSWTALKASVQLLHQHQWAHQTKR